jgi:PIN domain nuclease of toxin-antitoxin system
VGHFLLDTHVLLWLIEGSSQLSPAARSVISDNTNHLYFSVVSIWEITVKLNIGKLQISHTIAEIYTLLEQINVEVLTITQSDLEQYLPLPLHHRDPFDRILIAQAIDRSLVLVSADRSFGDYPVQKLWD